MPGTVSCEIFIFLTILTVYIDIFDIKKILMQL
jgi:hypothetical protein